LNISLKEEVEMKIQRGFKYTFEQEPQADTVAENQIQFLSFLEKSVGKKLK